MFGIAEVTDVGNGGVGGAGGIKNSNGSILKGSPNCSCLNSLLISFNAGRASLYGLSSPRLFAMSLNLFAISPDGT